MLHRIFYLSVSFPVVHRLLFFSCHSCRFIAPSDVKFLCFITLSTFFSYSTSDRPRRLSPGDQAIFRLGHLLSCMHSTCPYHFNMLFSILSKIVCVSPFFSLITSFLTCSSLDVLAALLQKSISVFNAT